VTQRTHEIDKCYPQFHPVKTHSEFSKMVLEVFFFLFLEMQCGVTAVFRYMWF